MKFVSAATVVALTLTVVGVSGYQSDTMTSPVRMTEEDIAQSKRETSVIGTPYGQFVRTTEPVDAP